MRCPRCGNENPPANRFCGMCGGSLLAPSSIKASEPVSVSAKGPATTEVTSAPARVADTSRPAPPPSASISGPSFLGLNDPPSQPDPRRRASLNLDPHPRSRNLDYLLEEEPRHHWGIGKILLILIALGLAVGFGYLRFKNSGLAWLNGLKKPSAVAQNSPAPDATTTTPPSITPDPQPPAQPAPQPSGTAPNIVAQGDNAATANAPAASTPSTPAPGPADTTKSNNAASTPSGSENVTPPKDKDPATHENSAETPDAATSPSETPKPAPKPVSPKPSAAAKPAAAYDPVPEARKYLYGRGSAQDCDRGLRLLKPAANQSNPKAMVEMGALYSAGLCTPRDLPTAYRWFALALRKDPENSAIQADLQKLWGEMTQPERQLAIKMTQ